MYGNFWGNLGNFLFHHLITLLSITLLTIHTYGDPHNFYFQFPFHLSLSLVLFLALSLSFCLYLTQMGQSRPLFCLFSSFSSYNFNNTNWKKHRLYAWDSNPGLKDGRRRQNHRTMAVLFRPNWYWHISKIGLLGSLSTGTPVGSIQVPAPIGSFTVNWFFKRTNMYLGTASDICNFYTCTTIS